MPGYTNPMPVHGAGMGFGRNFGARGRGLGGGGRGWRNMFYATGVPGWRRFGGYDASYASPTYVLALGLGVALLAGIGLRRWSRDILSDI